eukprot:TRINITY_DN5207_c0_g1_i1.p2 TRINITY_DN5207_c0_g1~~TRINITY_DN5207_c0_g1_i1.p2  ORF type:complete len:136 (+),score=39.39 TRINITY_DN5207_c0_g1_i1:45-452(+)
MGCGLQRAAWTDAEVRFHETFGFDDNFAPLADCTHGQISAAQYEAIVERLNDMLLTSGADVAGSATVRDIMRKTSDVVVLENGVSSRLKEANDFLRSQSTAHLKLAVRHREVAIAAGRSQATLLLLVRTRPATPP